MSAAEGMERQLGRNIKEVIAEFPRAAEALARHGIGCASYAVGTCLMRDIIDIHGLSAEQERTLLGEIAAVIFPGQNVPLPGRPAKVTAARPQSAAFSPPVRQLVQEHAVIGCVLALVPWIAELLASDPSLGFVAARGALGFIRSYADRYHHAKEEGILFAFFDPGMPILEAMCAEHESARAHVREMAAGIEEEDAPRVATHLVAYRSLLEDHIRKEDGILYPFLDAHLTVTQVGEMFGRFQELDAVLSASARDMESWVSWAEQRARSVAVR